MIIREVEGFGGDVIKFAGDALIAEWQASPPSPLQPSDRSGVKKIEVSKEIILKVALCAANIVNKCSDYPVYDEDESKVSDLNVYCGIGFGPMVGVHLGDDERKEYLLLGSPLKQVGVCIEVASAGEVVISPEALEVLEPMVDFDECVMSAERDRPRKIAAKSLRHFRPKDDVHVEARGARLRTKIEHELVQCDDLALKRLQELMSLYVHPAAVQDEKSTRAFAGNRGRASRRHKSKAELRGVFTLFINPLIEADLTGPSVEDMEVITLLNKVMLIVNTELSKFSGHLRQYILDDKGKNRKTEILKSMIVKPNFLHRACLDC
jgi:class 3 adenylate cyclase